MFCSNCGNTLNEGAKFCPKCGTPYNAANIGQNQQDNAFQPASAVNQYQQESPVQNAAPVNQYQQESPVQNTAPVNQYQPASPVQNVAAQSIIDKFKPQDSFSKSIVIMSLITAVLNVVITILWFVPTMKIDISSSYTSILKKAGLPGTEFAVSDTTQGAEVINIISIAMGVIAVALIILPIIKSDLLRVRKHIYQKVNAVWFGFWLLYDVISLDSQAPQQTRNIVKGVHLNFLGWVYVISCIAIIVITVLITRKIKSHPNSYSKK